MKISDFKKALIAWVNTEHISIKTEIKDGRIVSFEGVKKRKSQKKVFKVIGNDILGAFQKMEKWFGLIEV